MTLTKNDFTAFHWVKLQNHKPARIVNRGAGDDRVEGRVLADAEFTAVPATPLALGDAFSFASEDLPDLLRGVAFGVVELDAESGRVRVRSGCIG